jgi:uncharacterized protein (TIGR00730 family)
MRRVVVFCGSSSGSDARFTAQAILLGETLARQQIALVYGGARIGLMGAVADGALRAGGQVIGVLPRFLQSKEIAHADLTELHLVDSMHERKLLMNELCDGAIALPGGFGTLEEFFEMLTWAQLGLHQKPVALLNVAGFYDPLLALVQSMVDNALLKPQNQSLILGSDNIDTLLETMRNYQAAAVPKWITPVSS